jgi:CRP-like cAMP-binding protein
MQTLINIKEMFSKIPLFHGLSDEIADQLYLFVRRASFKAGSIILREDEKSGNLFVIVRGEVKTTITSRDGKEHTLSIHRKNEFFNEGSLVGEKNQPINAIAVRDTELLFISRRDFLGFLSKNPSFYERLVEQLVFRLQKAARQESSLALFDVSGRVARFLMDLAMEEGEKTDDDMIAITRPTQQEIALRISTTRESVSRALKEMETKGLIKIIGKRIIILKHDVDI